MALLIKADGTREDIVPKNGKTYGLEELQKYVGGYIEVAYLRNQIMVFNEEGKLCGLPTNKAATDIYHAQISPFDYVVGDVVLCGQDELD